MRELIIKTAVALLRFINLFFRPLKLKDRVVIISRQSDKPTLDIKLLRDCLESRGIETAVLTKTLQKSIAGALSYCLHMLKQLKYLASSKVVVLDGYCIAVSVLPKKKGQSVVQMWHALGAVKKFGWQTTENPDGHSRAVAEIMQMHRNYDFVLTPSKATGRFFAEAFRVPESSLVYFGLPRIDYLRCDAEKSREKIEKVYPKIKGKTNVLYVPTFRKNTALKLDRLVAGFDFESYNLIIKKHFLDTSDYSWAETAGAVVDTAFSSMEWLRISQKVVTDYSAISFEAAILDKELYIFQSDVSDYSHNVGLNMDLTQEAIGEYVCCSEDELFNKLKEPYRIEKVKEFADKYIEIETENCTEKLCSFIAGLMTR